MGEKESRHILLIVIKNISALDYTIPLLWKLNRVRPNDRLSVLFCTMSPKAIVRRSKFYPGMLAECGCRVSDFADYLSGPAASVPALWRGLFSGSPRDSAGIRGRFSAKRIARRTVGRLREAVIRRVRVSEILPHLQPDVVLFDNRSKTDFHRNDEFFDYFERERQRIVLLPHAPHHTGTAAFTPFRDQGNPLPDYCDYWTPFVHDRPWESAPVGRERFHYVGYPGLDSEWLDWVGARDGGGVGPTPARDSAARPLRCLFIIRKFLEPGQRRPPGHDPYVFDHDEFSHYLDLLTRAVSSCGHEVEVVVKPHPSNDFRSVHQIFGSSGLRRWSVTHDSIYAEIGRTDFVVSLYSTTLLMPAMAGVPVVLLHSRIQEEIEQWPELRELYSGLKFYLRRPEDLVERLGEVVALSRDRAQGAAKPDSGDIAHLRRFYPDGALERALKRLED